MLAKRTPNRRRAGTILPLTVISLVSLCGMVALAIDLSLVAIARNQCQNAADSAAMAGARSLTGDVATYNNAPQAVTDGQNAALANKVLSQAIQPSQVTVQIGILKYDTTTTRLFQIPAGNLTSSPGGAPAGNNWGAAQATVTATVNFSFAKIFGLASAPASATAQAIHRPRDVSLIIDFTGSMAFDSYLASPTGGYPPYVWWPPAQSLNPDTLVPKFGHYDPSTPSTNYANLVSSANYTLFDGEVFKQGNTTSTTTSGSEICGDFWTLANGSGSTLVNAFNNPGVSPTPVPAGNLDADNYPLTVPGGTGSNQGGEKPWKISNNTGTTFAHTFGEIFGLPTNGTTSDSAGTDTTFQRNTKRGHASNTSITGFQNFENWGYAGSSSGTWQGYTYGPAYWGKTFFIWPPCPDYTANPANPASSTWKNSTNGPNSGPIRDWRQRFFWKFDGAGNRYRLDDNNVMWNSNGTTRPPDNSNPYTDPSGVTWTYQINYDAVLYWLKNNGPTGKLFPDNVRSGRILYYDQIPDNVNNYTTDLNQRFWKEYIDYVCGQREYTKTGSPVTTSLLSGFGTGFSFQDGSGTSNRRQWIYTKPSNLTPMPASPAYMDYRDNPQRPKMRFWFGPMSFCDFIWCDYASFDSYGNGRYMRPGTCHEAPMWVLKTGINSALQDIQKNHPNDWVSLIFFCFPKTGSGDTNSTHRFNRVPTPLGKDYQRMINSLWYPPAVIQSDGSLIPFGTAGSEIRPYDSNFAVTSNFVEVPYANGGTCPAYGFQLAYNQFSGNSTLVNYASTSGGIASAPTGDAGGLGRRGARKMIIFETDGVPNVSCSSSTFQNAGAYNSYYRIRQGSEFPTGVDWASFNTAANDCYSVVQQICALDSASSPGYSTSGKPVLIHCLGFGGIIEINNSLTSQVLTFLQQIQTYGKTQANASDPLPDYKRIIGTSDQRINKLKTAFTIIMQDGVQVSMFK